MNKLLIALLLIIISLPCFAESPKNQIDTDTALATDRLNLIKNETLNDDTLDAALQQKVVELLDQAEKWLRQNSQIDGKLDLLNETIKNAPAEIKKLHDSLGPFELQNEDLTSFIKNSN
ncbi:MAG: hypothetical protein ABW121_15145, partial [Candidatus Thiodiazotropha sp. 6PLUC7]